MSHDLHEPIRLISTYARGRLDEDAGVFMDNILNGATRARELLAALLAHTEVARAPEEVAAPVDLQ